MLILRLEGLGDLHGKNDSASRPFLPTISEHIFPPNRNLDLKIRAIFRFNFIHLRLDTFLFRVMKINGDHSKMIFHHFSLHQSTSFPGSLLFHDLHLICVRPVYFYY